MFGLFGESKTLKLITGAAVAASLAIAGVSPAHAVAPLGSSSLLKQTQTQNLPGIDGANPSNGSRWLPQSVVLNDRVYYIASTDATGPELFTSDGTAAGTYVVKETVAGASTGLYSYYSKLTVSNGKIYFWGASHEAWVSDGTANGTGILKDLSVRGSAQPQNFTKVGTKTFFTAYDSSQYFADAPAGNELWVTNGTAAGTTLVKDINPGNYLDPNGYYYNNNSNISSITECNNKAFFAATNPTYGTELWVSDGTEAGTSVVQDTIAGAGSSYPSNMACVNNKLIYSATNSSNGYEPWVSDGTSAGTMMLKDIVTGAGQSAPSGMTYSAGKVYFKASEGINGVELWSTDGTSAGTSLVKNIAAGSADSNPTNFVEMGGKTYFTASDSRGNELWSTDGTTVGTLFVSDINQTSPGASSNPKDLYSWNGKLYFSADNGSIGRELWVTDGSNSGTTLIKDMFPGISDMLDQSNSTVNVPFFAGTTAGLYFTANSPIYAQEMWITDGTNSGTRLLVDAKTGPGFSYAKNAVAFNGKIYFSASSAYFGQELWSTDLATNTQQIIDIYPGAPSSMKTDAANNMVVFNNRLYFTARNPQNGYELWSTDGTVAGTTQAFDLLSANSGVNSSSYNGPRYLTVCNGKLFMNFTNNGDYELWSSDGTLAGTSLVKNINQMVSSDPQQLTCLNNEIYFTADDSYYWQSATNTVGRELYKSNGTSAGTILMSDLNQSAMSLGSGAGTAHSTPSYLTVVGSKLYFSAYATGNESELYYTDGSAVTKIDVYPGATSSSPTYLTKYNGNLYFSAYMSGSGVDMVKLDGTTQALTAIDVMPGSSSFSFLQPSVMGGRMWFQSSGEMFTSDGTAANTGIFEDLLPSGSSNPEFLVSLGGVLMYLTYDAVLGSQPRYIIGEGVYNISFNGNGSTSGIAPADVSVMSISATVPGNTGNLVKTGYRFIGWNTSPSGVGTAYLPGSTITPIVDTPLFAQWATNATYTVTYHPNGATGGVAAPAVGNVDIPIYLDNNSGNLTKPGYKFDGWSTATSGGTSYAAGFRYTATADITLYAKWTALPAFTISFNLNGATSGTAPASLTGVYSTATLPDQGTMLKTGSVFAGWNTAADGLGSAFAAGETLTPQAAMTLYAQWSANTTYTLTYDANTATSGTVPALATAASTYVVIDPNTGSLFKTGFVFSGWNTAADGSGTTYLGNNNFLLNANTTFYAKWTVANYTVTYSGNGNTGGTAPTAVTGVSVSTVASANSGNLVKAGYTFVGWNTLPSGLGTDYAVGSTYSPTSSSTLYAKWTSLPTYSIAYDANGAVSGGVPVTQSGVYATTTLDLNSGNLQKTNFYFAGWNTQADGLGTTYSAGSSYLPTANITLFALWSASATFTLTYDGNQKTSGVPPLAQTGITGTATVSGNTSNLARIGYRFDGWANSNSASTADFLAGDSITLTADTTLFAVWTAVPTYTLSYSGNGQTTGSVPMAVTTSDGSVVLSANLNVLTKANYIFNGWNTAANGTGTHYAVGSTFTLSANTTIYAEWLAEPYTITYNANGAASGSVPVATTASGAQTVSGNTGSLALPGYNFSGWNTSADGTGTNRAVASTFTPTANTTLFAKWVTYTITYSGNGSTSGAVPAAVQGVASFTVSGNTGSLDKSGFFFAGWNTLANGTGTTIVPGNAYTPTANATLYAVWTATPSYSISYNANGSTSGTVPAASTQVAGTVTLAGNTGSLAKAGNMFIGWNTQADGQGTPYAQAATFTLAANTVFYAQWQVLSYTVTYDGNGADSGTAPAATTASGAQLVAANSGGLGLTGHTFAGWNTLANGAGVAYLAGSSYSQSANVTLFAVWTLVPLYSVTFDINGADGGTAPGPLLAAAGNVVLANNTGTLTRTGKVFGGWNSQADGLGITYAEGATFALASNTTLYALWSDEPIVIPTVVVDPIAEELKRLAALPRVTKFSSQVFELSGGKLVLTGLNLGRTALVTIGGKLVQIDSVSDTTLVLTLPAMPEGVYSLVLFAEEFGTFQLQDYLKYSGIKVLQIANFFSATGKVTEANRAKLLAFVLKNSEFKFLVLKVAGGIQISSKTQNLSNIKYVNRFANSLVRLLSRNLIVKTGQDEVLGLRSISIQLSATKI